VSKFDYDAAKAPPAFKEATRETPEYLGQSIVIVPLSIGVGFAVLLGGLLICWGLQKSGRGALVAGGVAMAGCALFAFWRVFKDELYMAIETITGHDWNRDGYIGAPSTHIQFQASDRTTWMATLPAPPELIYDWGKTYLNGGSMGYRQWQHRFALLPDGSDGDRRYAAFRAALVRHELAIEKGKSGISLTERGIQEFTEYVHQNPQGTPLLEG